MPDRQLSCRHLRALIGILSPYLVRAIQDYAKSAVAVANYQLHIPGGDLVLAGEYLERVAGSNTEEASQASELLKAVKAGLQERRAMEGGE